MANAVGIDLGTTNSGSRRWLAKVSRPSYRITPSRPARAQAGLKTRLRQLPRCRTRPGGRRRRAGRHGRGWARRVR